MELFLPWLDSRKVIFLLIIIDGFILFAIDYFYNFLNLPTFSYYLFFLIWIIISYVLGKYDSEKSKFNLYNFLIITFKNFLSLVISYLFLVILYVFSKYDSTLINFYEIFKVFFIVNFFSFSFSFYFKRVFKNKSNIDFKRFIFVSNCDKENLDNEYLFSSFLNTLVRPNEFSIENIKKKEDFIIIDNDLKISDEFYKEIFHLKKKGYMIESLNNYCNKNLEYISPKFINKSLFIDNKIFSEKFSFQMRLKKVGDILFSIFLLIISSPLLIFIYFCSLLMQGRPVFYSQERNGLNGKKFLIWKFRSMINNSERGKAQWATANDPRITKLGKLLRKSRIDELPQLISVIKGDMSLIGPRPERPELEEMLIKKIDNYELRYFIKPGLSGWAQVNYPYGNSITDSEIKLGYDLFYIKNFSFFFDFLIFLKTIKLVFNLKGSNPK